VKRFALLGAFALVVCVVAAASADPGPAPALQAANPAGKVPPRGEAGHAGHGKGGHSPNLTWHGGQIMTSAAVTPIFWGAGWASSSFAGDKISGIDSFYKGVGGTAYIGTNTEYVGSNGQVTTSVSSSKSIVDTSSSLSHAPSTSQVLVEVASQISNPVANGYYPVYSDLPRGNAGYCAWHSVGTCNGVRVQFAYFFKLDGDPGCDPQDTSGQHSQGLAAIANVSGHELSEARTDPSNPGAWYDSQGEENGDKCAWTFGAPLVTFSNGTEWKIQGEWSNAAYSAGTGYPNSSGQKGCLSGK
jgi:hypothetical protein